MGCSFGKCTGYSSLLPTGSPAASPVEPPSPTTENVLTGATPTAVTFGAFTDPDSVIASYSAQISNASGTTAIATGSGLGPYTVSGYSDGNAYSIILNALDGGGDIVASAVHTVGINDAGTPGWEVVTTVDLTGLDVLNLSAVGTYGVTKGGAAFATVQTSRTSTPTSVTTAGASGILMEGPNTIAGTFQAAIDITTAVSLTGAGTLVSADFYSPIAIQIQLTQVGSVSGGSGNGGITGIGTNRSGFCTSTLFLGMRNNFDGATDDMEVRNYQGAGNDNTWINNEATTANMLVTVILQGGGIGEIWVNRGSSAFVTPRTENRGPGNAGRSSVSAGVGLLSLFSTMSVGICVAKSTGSYRMNWAGYRILRQKL